MHLRFSSLRICLGFLIAALVLTACTKTSEQLAADAKARAASGDRAGAIIDLKAAVQQQPDNADYRLALGRLYNANFQPADAENELLRAQKLGNLAQGETVTELARALRTQLKLAELLNKCQPDEHFSPAPLASLYALRGRAQHALANNEDAAESYKRSTAIIPDNADAQVLKAQIEAGAGDLKKALGTVDALLIKYPLQYDGLTYRAEIMRLLGRLDDAIAAYNQVLKVNPRDYRALSVLTTLYLGERKYDEARKLVKVLIATYGDHPAAVLQQGVLQMAEGNAQDALTSAQRALKDTVDYPEAKLLAGVAHFSLGSYAQAEEMLSKALISMPGSSYARMTLAEVLLVSEQPARALEVVRPLIEADSPDVRVYALAGDAALKLGDREQATKWFDKAARMDSDIPAYKVAKAISKLNFEKGGTGLAELGDALLYTKTASLADEMLILTYLSHGQVDKAQDALDKLRKRDPDGAITKNMSGVILRSKSDAKGATAEFEAALKKDPSYFPAAENLAQMDVIAGNTDAAKSRYESILTANKKNLGAWMAVAQLEMMRNRPKAAVEVLNNAIDEVSHAIPPRFYLASIYLSMNEKQHAADTAEAALKVFPDRSEFITLLAETELANGNTNKAIQTYERLLSLYPNSLDVQIKVAEFQTKAGQPNQAEQTLRSALSKGVNSKLQVALLDLLVAQAKFDDATTFVEEIQKKQPKAPIGWVMMGEVLEAHSRAADAVKAYDSALQLQQSGIIAVKRYHAQLKADKSRAMSDLEAWSEKHPTDVVALMSIGNTYLEMENYKRAATSYEAIFLTKQVPLDVVNNLAWCYFKLKDPRALDLIKAAVSDAPNSAASLDTYGWILLDQNNVKDSVGILKRAAAIDNDNPEIEYHLAAALAKGNDTSSARDILKKITTGGKAFAALDEAKKLLESLR